MIPAAPGRFRIGRPDEAMKTVMENISVVLVGTRHGGNIGSAARAMKNCGVRTLVLVDPPPLDAPEVCKLAWGALDVVQGARVCLTLGEAVAGCGLVVGTTRRRGRGRRPVTDLREAIPRIAAATRRNRVAILFGREDKGLSNGELAFCQCAVKIPASRLMPSLNVAQAVMVVLHGLFEFAAPGGTEPPPPLVPQERLITLYARIEAALASLGYSNADGDRRVLEGVMKTLKRIFGRSGIADDEWRALHGICQQVERYVALREKG